MVFKQQASLNVLNKSNEVNVNRHMKVLEMKYHV